MNDKNAVINRPEKSFTLAPSLLIGSERGLVLNSKWIDFLHSAPDYDYLPVIQLELLRGIVWGEGSMADDNFFLQVHSGRSVATSGDACV